MTSRRVSWSSYRDSIGDRAPLFAELTTRWPVARALYPGSYVDLSPSTCVPDVTYVDTDQRAARYFGDLSGPIAELGGRTTYPEPPIVRFVHADYTDPLPVEPASVDLLISLYAGPVSEHCHSYLRPGGLLLANTSHGDAWLAALASRFRLLAAVQHRSGRYRLTEDLDGHLVPRRGEVDRGSVLRSGRGVAAVRSAFAYVFELRATSSDAADVT